MKSHRPGTVTRTRRHRIRNFLGEWLIGTLVLAVTVAILPGITVYSLAAVPFVVLWLSIFGALLRPVMIRLAGLLGWVGSALLALFANAFLMYLALEWVDGIEDDGFGWVFVASWVYAAILAAVEWLLLADTDDAFLAWVIRMAKRRRKDVATTEVPGVIVVQVDGLPAPVLEWGVKSGNFPTLSRWVRDGGHSWSEWRASVPSTTPVSQAGILHGCNHDMPAFRWYEKDLGRLVVSNHPPDAALIESRISDGHGLLADNGVSISNLFSGDAETSLLTMSGLRRGPSGMGPSQSFAAFVTHPFGFVRAFMMTLGEMVKELYQARRQKRLGIEPRVHRGGSYVALRGVTNVLLRDLNTALVVESMMRGVNVVYVDYVDYDEIAHHAGVVRAESLRALEGIDHVLGMLETAAAEAPRPYRFVVVSDHGQSQGATFSQRAGRPLQDLVRDLMTDGGSIVSATGAVEDWGPLNTFLSQLAQQGTITGDLTRFATRRRTQDEAVSLGPGGAETEAAGAGKAGERPDLVVVGSGNLGGIWFPREPGRLRLERIGELYPGLVAGLVKHPAIGFVVVDTESQGPVAINEGGVHRLRDGTVDGVDPLAPFGPRAPGEFARVASFPNAPDIYVNSMYDPVLDEVAAFEELVGCHGGVGGWQTRAVLVHPSDWPLAEDLLDHGELVGAVAVHRQLVRWLEALGHRSGLTPRSVEAPASPGLAPPASPGMTEGHPGSNRSL